MSLGVKAFYVYILLSDRSAFSAVSRIVMTLSPLALLCPFPVPLPPPNTGRRSSLYDPIISCRLLADGVESACLAASLGHLYGLGCLCGGRSLSVTAQVSVKTK